MAKHRITITESYTIERTVTIEVEADTVDGAVNMVKYEVAPIPADADPRWQARRTDYHGFTVSPAI